MLPLSRTERIFAMNGKRALLPSERREKLAQQVAENGSLSVEQLAKLLQVSEVTIRRDLNKLSSGGVVQRVRGGVSVPAKSSFIEQYYSDRLEIEKEKKTAIARQALRHVRGGDFLFLDAGTTSYYFAKELSELERCTVVTNDIFIAHTIVVPSSCNVILTGGMLYAPGSLLMGPLAESFIQQIKVNTVFVTCDSVDVDWGLSSKSMGEAAIKKQLCLTEARHILLVDSTKFGKRSMARFASLTAIDLVIVDEEVDRSILDRLEEEGVAYEVAPFQS